MNAIIATIIRYTPTYEHLYYPCEYPVNQRKNGGKNGGKKNADLSSSGQLLEIFKTFYFRSKSPEMNRGFLSWITSGRLPLPR